MQTTDDILSEGGETFDFRLSNAQGGGGPAPRMDPSEVTTTINASDPLSDPPDDQQNLEALVSIRLTVSPSSVNEGAGSTPFTVTATHDGSPQDEAVTIQLALAGTATAGTGKDYTAPASASITIPANSASRTETLTLNILDDTETEGDETIIVGGSSGDLVIHSATITINDAEATYLSITGPTAEVSEGSSATFTVTLSEAITADVSVAWTGVPITAQTSDYTESSGTVTFPANSAAGATQTFTIATIQDTLSEPAETFGAVLGEVSGAGAAGVYVKSTAATARVTIAESDPITVSIRGVPSVREGNKATYTVFVSGGTPTADLTVSYATEDGTATADSDYTAVPETSLTFTSTNHAGKTVTVQTTEDTLTEPDETFTVKLSSPSGGGGPAPVLDVNGTSVETTIEDDDEHIGDPPPINDPPEESTVISLSLEPVYILESAKPTQVTVTATHKFGVTLASDVTVNLAWGGTATPGSAGDYTATTPASITILAGQVSASDTLTITPIDDDVMEDDETITVRGSVETTDSEEEVLVGSAQTVIVDDDEDITLTVSELSVDPDRIEENAPTFIDVTVTATLKNLDSLPSEKTVNLGLRGTASSPDDYTAKALSSVTIPAGSKSGSGTLRITPFNDELIEGNETIVVSGKATDLTVKPAVITIVDDDRALLSITGPSSMDEGSNARVHHHPVGKLWQGCDRALAGQEHHG